ncbi:virulence factor Mce-like protein [Mycolicibacterium sp. BK556]|uniref:MCE family protein n=1 Tax=Mycobacteriaceae TaxID=1762 RepID=UPI00106119BC|nr:MULTISPECIES: MlaD family protein [Mycobacteriaceae]MBB3603691.1 virulence factor Mce-like protein [Mycolicibacterium sp. BK556]MBB3633886.1 virulence factor Mce-like protein [Mycolicibacterium sp. BK607]MBB3751468.1 virulence factor Mce-like protein [Mycolicibacterium sp. BK634]TDO11997.1 virulence factor Mce-like protein [Mycobacterium sp. BK086]
MLTRFVRNQLIIFTIASVVGIGVMVVAYLQVGTLLGIGKITVTLQLPRTGGLYQFSNVTYRGVQLGKVTEVRPTRTGAEATMSLDTNPKVPADLEARVLSVSAVGEQYVDLVPRTDSGPYLQDGSVISVKDARIPQAVGPMLDQTNQLLKSIPTARIPDLLNSTYQAFNGAGDDLTTLNDSASKLAADFSGTADQARTLVEDSRPLLDGQLASTDAIRTWARSLAGITDQLNTNDPQWRGILANGPGAADEATALLNQVKPTLPVLLANLTTLGQVGVTYHKSLEQLLVLLPPYIGSIQAVGSPLNNPTGMTLGDFTLTISDPPACTVGFLPPSQWRSPEDTSDADTPDGLYCKLPQDSPTAVRGARNYPCMAQPGKRAPTVEICDSDKPFEPLAMRQHATGPSPIDPNLIAQGIPPDDRTTLNNNIYGPLQGTPMPTGPIPAPPAAPIPPQAGFTGPVGAPNIAPTDTGGAPGVAPSAFNPGAPGGPSVAIATYDPATGQYATPDGNVFRQTDLVQPGGQQSWKDLLPTT